MPGNPQEWAHAPRRQQWRKSIPHELWFNTEPHMDQRCAGPIQDVRDSERGRPRPRVSSKAKRNTRTRASALLLESALPGVRPSSGAAGLIRAGSLELRSGSGVSDIAAPQDGRTRLNI